MPRAQRILITNFVLDSGTGSELYVFDLATKLLAVGRLPIVYSPRLGALARKMQLRGITVTDELDRIGDRPDVIHGHHTLESLAMAVRFPEVPMVFVCHDSSAWHDTAPTLASIRKYVGVDQACYDRLVFQDGIPPSSVKIISNGVDFDRFPARPSLAVIPRSLVLFGNEFRPEHVELVRKSLPALRVESIGVLTEQPLTEPGAKLLDFDIVLARGRCAREAIATGAATVVAGATGMGEMVTSGNIAYYEANNFGRRLLQRSFTSENILHAVSMYNSVDATEVTNLHRSANSLDRMVAELIEIYDVLISDMSWKQTQAPDQTHAIASWLQWASLRANVSQNATETDATSTPFLPFSQSIRKKSLSHKVYRECGRALRRFRKRAG